MAPAFLKGNVWPEASPASLRLSEEQGCEPRFGQKAGDPAAKRYTSRGPVTWGAASALRFLEKRELVGPPGANPLSHYPTAPLALGCGSGKSLQGIDCQRNKSKARVKCNNHVRGEKLEKYTTGSLNSYLVDKLLIEMHYSSVPDSQKCLSCLEDHNKTACLLCLPLILMEKDRALCNKV